MHSVFGCAALETLQKICGKKTSRAAHIPSSFFASKLYLYLEPILLKPWVQVKPLFNHLENS